MDRNALAKCLLTLCRQVKDTLSEEPRLTKLKSPVYILGKVKVKLVFVYKVTLISVYKVSLTPSFKVTLTSIHKFTRVT